MSLEAITKIRQVEEGMEREKSDARAQVQKLAADAEREGRELLRAGAEKARAENAAAMEKEPGGKFMVCAALPLAIYSDGKRKNSDRRRNSEEV